MMSEEETGSEDYVRHRQSWRSTKFNELIDQLDSNKSARSLAKRRDNGAEVIRPIPCNVKQWMLRQEDDLSNNGSDDHETQE